MPILRGNGFYYVKNSKTRYSYIVGNKKSREMAKAKALLLLKAIMISKKKRNR
jgi:hypothetical protein